MADAHRNDTAALTPLRTGLCISFGVGTIGVSIVLNTVAVYFPALMSTVLGVSPAVAGSMLMMSKIYDAFADLFIGSASDRSASRWGRRRPFLLAGALMSFASLLVIFLAPSLEGNALLIYMGLALILYSTGYSLFNVPYLAMPAEMTDNFDQRLRLISFRTAFIGIGQLFSLAVTAWLIQFGGGGAAGYRLMGAVMATIALVTMLVAFFGTRSARMIPRGLDSHKLNLGDMRSLGQNRPLMLLMGAKATQYIAFGIMQPANLLFLLNVAKTGYTGMVHMAVAQNLTVFAAQPIWLRLGRRFGKRNCYLAAILIMIPVSLSWYWVGAGVPMWEVWLRAAGFGFASGGALLMSTSMLPDCSEYDRRRTGQRREGLISSLYAVNEKIGFALGALALGWGLSLGGYVATTGGKIIDQPANAIWALFAVKAFIPSAVLAVGLLLIWLYDLDEAKLRATPPVVVDHEPLV
jgi:GPH family glycoside/pentoside/hexuronide:cation symporter